MLINMLKRWWEIRWLKESLGKIERDRNSWKQIEIHGIRSKRIENENVTW
jgi:hypothetical protein